MNTQPPYMSDEEADRTWHQANDRLFPQTSRTALESENHIAKLQQLLDQRHLKDSQLSTKQNTEPKQSDSPNPSQRVLRKRTSPNDDDSSQATSKAPRTAKKIGTTGPTRKQPARTNSLSVSDGLVVDNSKHMLTDNLVVDTGVSYVVLRQQHAHLLSHVQLSSFGQSPYAILRAANGQILNAIGRGMFTVPTITVIAYIFRNEDLVHNLLGIAPFADRGFVRNLARYRLPSAPS
jgi:hypothetical protein